MERNSLPAIIRILGEKRTALVLMSAITGFAVVGSVVPQAHITPPEIYLQWQNGAPYAALFDTLGLTRLFYTWYFYLPVLLFTVNLSICTWRQAKKLRAARLPEIGQAGIAVTRLRNRAELAVPATGAAPLPVAAAVLRKHGFRRQQAGRRSLLVVKGLPGGYGMVVFHLALLFIVLSGALTGLSRFNGYLMLGEGQHYDGSAGPLLVLGSGPLYRAQGLPFGLRVERLEPEYNKDGILRNFATLVTYLDSSVSGRHRVTYNTPLTYRGYTFHQDKYGFAPRLMITNPDGSIAYNGFLIVDTVTSPGGDSYRGGVKLGELSLAMELYPDHIEYQGGDYTRSSRPGNPVLLMSVTSGDGELFNGRLPLGEETEFAGYTVLFEELRNWTGFFVVFDRGFTLLFIAFFLALSGLLLYYLFPLQYIFVCHEDGCIRIAGRGERFPAGFAAGFAALKDELAAALTGREEAS